MEYRNGRSGTEMGIFFRDKVTVTIWNLYLNASSKWTVTVTGLSESIKQWIGM